MEVTQSMQLEPNETRAAEASVDGLVRTRYTLDVRVVRGHERVHTPSEQTTCLQCGGSARRSFAMFRDLTEVKR